MSLLKRLSVACIALTSALFISACEENEASAIAAAQECLNQMNSSMSSAELTTKAAECRTLLGSPKSEDGFVIQCSSFFLEEGFFGSKMTAAFDRTKGNANNDVLNLASTFAFKTTGNATSANTACQQTGLTTFKAFGDLAVLATTIGSIGGLTIPTDGSATSIADFTAALTTFTATATSDQLATVGSSVISMASSLCASESNSGTGDTCSTLNQFNSGTDNVAAGKCIAFCMAGNKGVACPDNTAITCP